MHETVPGHQLERPFAYSASIEAKTTAWNARSTGVPRIPGVEHRDDVAVVDAASGDCDR